MLIVPATGLAVGPLAGDEGNTGLDFVADPEDEPDRAREEIDAHPDREGRSACLTRARADTRDAR